MVIQDWEKEKGGIGDKKQDIYQSLTFFLDGTFSGV